MKKIDAKRLFLLNASKRDNITLGSIMITIKRGNVEITCDNASEAAQLLRELDGQTQVAEAPKNPWTGTRFWNLIENIGPHQLKVLKALLRDGRLSDEALRAELGLESNQQLAGVLSGISKQAAAREIPARTVFKIDNEYAAGQAAKWYVVAPEFQQIAADNNWPDEKEEPKEELKDGW